MRTPTPRLALFGFQALLPGFFVYHFLLAKGLIPPVFGGYSTAMAMVWFAPLSMLFVQQVSRPGTRCAMDGAFVAFVVYTLVVLLLNMALGARGEAAGEQIGVIPQFVVLYIVARSVDPRAPRLRGVLVMTLLAMSVAIVTNADEGTFLAVSLDLLGSADYFANYQAYGFVYSVCLIYVLCATPSRKQRMAIYLFAFPTLFLNGARTELIGVVLLTLVLEFLRSKHKLFTLVIAAALVAAAAAALPLLADLYPESRTIFLFLDYSDDLSKLERARMLYDGWKSIQESPWVGALGSHKPGEHIHNALSAWVDLGLPGFAAYVALIVLPLIDLCLLRRADLNDPDYQLAVSFAFLVALFAITAKHYTHQLLPLAVGAYARYLMMHRHGGASAQLRSA